MPTLRPATLADATSVAQLETTIFGSTAWNASLVREELTGPHRFYAVLEDDGVIVGYAGILCVGIEADVQTMAVTEQARGRGYGKLLLTALIREAQTRGAEHMFLEVREDNPVAVRLYEAHGFQTIGRRERYYQPEGVDALVMHRPLSPTDTGEESQ